MAVPARHTSKSKKNKRRTHYKMTAPTVSFASSIFSFVSSLHETEINAKIINPKNTFLIYKY